MDFDTCYEQLKIFNKVYKKYVSYFEEFVVDIDDFFKTATGEGAKLGITFTPTGKDETRGFSVNYLGHTFECRLECSLSENKTIARISMFSPELSKSGRRVELAGFGLLPHGEIEGIEPCDPMEEDPVEIVHDRRNRLYVLFCLLKASVVAKTNL